MNKYDFYWKFFEQPKRKLYSFFNRKGNAVIIQYVVNKHRGELVYDIPFSVVKLLGWTDQYDEDYYYVIYDYRKGVQLYSCVGGFYWLKNRLSKWEYYHSLNVFNLNTLDDKEIKNLVEDMGIVLK